MKFFRQFRWCVAAIFICATAVDASTVHNYVFFGMDREQITNAVFLDTKAFEGAQLKYSWRQLEHQKDQYDFADIKRDLAFLKSKDKKLFVQLGDSSFSPDRVPVPRYLMEDPQFHGGANNQYDIDNDDQDHARIQGWVARRWDPAVQERLHKLLFALGREFDGKIEGINLSETAVDIPLTGKLCPQGFTAEAYRDAVLTNMMVLKRAFPHSVAMQYANFMPGDVSNLQSVYRAAEDLNVAVGGPDLLPFRPFQMANSYPLLRDAAGKVPSGIAAQDGNYDSKNPKTGEQVTVPEMIEFATGYLKVKYIFWCTQEPFFSQSLLPVLKVR